MHRLVPPVEELKKAEEHKQIYFHKSSKNNKIIKRSIYKPKNKSTESVMPRRNSFRGIAQTVKRAKQKEAVRSER